MGTDWKKACGMCIHSASAPRRSVSAFQYLDHDHDHEYDINHFLTHSSFRSHTATVLLATDSRTLCHIITTRFHPDDIIAAISFRDSRGSSSLRHVPWSSRPQGLMYSPGSPCRRGILVHVPLLLSRYNERNASKAKKSKSKPRGK